MYTGRMLLIAIGMLAASVWIGSLASLAVVSGVARRELDGAARVALFRGIGRRYRIVGTGSLGLSIAVGAALAWPPSQVHGNLAVTFVLGGVLVAVTAAGMAQARRMTIVRRQSLEHPDDAQLIGSVRRGAALAGVLRATIALVTLVIVVLGAHLLDR